MTPTQRVKCDLLGITILAWDENKYNGCFVIKGTGLHVGAYLCVPDDGLPIAWSTKQFKTINEAIEAASNPSKFGLAWDI